MTNLDKWKALQVSHGIVDVAAQDLLVFAALLVKDLQDTIKSGSAGASDLKQKRLVSLIRVIHKWRHNIKWFRLEGVVHKWRHAIL